MQINVVEFFFPLILSFCFCLVLDFFYYSYFSGSPQLQHSKGLDQRYFCNPSQKKRKEKKRENCIRQILVAIN
jgi:hypothetical protein